MESENNFIIRKEDELLLYCARTKIDEEIKEKIVSLIGEDFDWEYLIQLASKHKLRPLLYYNLNSVCPKLIPEDTLNELKDYFNFNLHKNLLLTGELIKILKLLKSNDINAVPYKGPVLTYWAYDNLSLREFKDIDIFIKKKDALEVIEIMNNEGYTPNFQIDENLVDIYLKSQKGFVFINKNLNFSVDFQWQFSGNFFSFPVSPEPLIFEDLDEIFINGNNISVFSPENILLILSVHAAGHQWSRLSWIVDIAELIQNKGLNWEEIINKAHKLKIVRIVNLNLLLASKVGGFELPNKLLKNISSDKSLKKMVRLIERNIFQEDPNTPNLMDWFYLHIKIRERFIDGLIDSIKHLTIPSIEELKIIKLHKSFYFIYYLIKPFNLLRRYKIN